MTLQQLFRSLLKQSQSETAAFDLSQLFDMRFGKNARLLHPDHIPDPEAASALERDWKRLESGYPLQYIMGEWDFYGLTFKVGEGVLIPRADTEVTVETALRLLEGVQSPKIADLCAGSGAIALALAENLPCCRIYAVELFEQACSYLESNIAALDKKRSVIPVKADVLNDLGGVLPAALDIIVSNPPYITAGEMMDLPENVRHEPETALFGGEDGLDFYRAIAAQAGKLLSPGGKLVFEVGWKQSNAVAQIMERSGFLNIRTEKDLSGIERCVYGVWPVQRRR